MMSVIKVRSFKRSGTNFLMKLMYENFYRNMNLGRELEEVGEGDYTLDGEVITGKFVQPFVKLFGGHRHAVPNPRQMVYIYRDGRDVYLSHYLREVKRGCTKPIHEWYEPRRFFNVWRRHVEYHINLGMCTVRYENLLQEPQHVLKKVAKHYGLRFLGPIVTEVGAVGWDATNQHMIGKWKSSHLMTQQALDAYEKEIPADFPARYD